MNINLSANSVYLFVINWLINHRNKTGKALLRNNVVSSGNNFCLGKNITYSEWGFVALGFQH